MYCKYLLNTFDSQNVDLLLLLLLAHDWKREQNDFLFCFRPYFALEMRMYCIFCHLTVCACVCLYAPFINICCVQICSTHSHWIHCILIIHCVSGRTHRQYWLYSPVLLLLVRFTLQFCLMWLVARTLHRIRLPDICVGLDVEGRVRTTDVILWC